MRRGSHANVIAWPDFSYLGEDMCQDDDLFIGGQRREVIDFYEYAAGEGRRMFGETVPSELPNKMCLTTRLPVGPVGLITPWNFPMAIPAWKSGAALIAGCSFVLKPSSLTPLCAARFVEVLDEAGFPAGVVNMVTGTGSVVGDGLVAHPDIRAISFTGGVRPREEGLRGHRHREEGGRQAPHGREEADRGFVRPRVLHLPDGLRGGPKEAPGSRVNLRAGVERPQGERLRRRGRNRELRQVRTQFLDLHERPPVGVPSNARTRSGDYVRERADDRRGGPTAIRGDEGDRADGHAGSGNDGPGGVHVLEDRVRRLLRSPATGAD